ncbi:MAG: succinate dehydrogenase assembly factor 2 [Thiotrichales bacterium]|nr:succinate dehydrogenase assembly factor 2 [Thiotrichales bacterium]
MEKPERSRILWRCRRGMREMDLLFNQYVEEHYNQLDAAGCRALESLLEESDPDIMDWIMRRKEPQRSDYTPIISNMRNLREKLLKSN